MVKCIESELVKPLEPCPDCGKEDAKGHHSGECIHILQRQLAAANARIAELEKIAVGLEKWQYDSDPIEALQARIAEARECFEALGAFNPEILELSKVKVWLKKEKR